MGNSCLFLVGGCIKNLSEFGVKFMYVDSKLGISPSQKRMYIYTIYDVQIENRGKSKESRLEILDSSFKIPDLRGMK